MPRPCQRATLENGLKLDLNRLARRGFIDPGGYKASGISWSHDGEQIASGLIRADMSGTDEGWFTIKIGELDQRIILVARPRHFGGRQWFFMCPYLNHRATVLWMPPGARSFACRQKWGRQVAYASQFLDRDSRAHQAKSKITARLCAIDGLDPEDWDFPPKPKWMRWKTYKRAKAKYDHYEEMLDISSQLAVCRLLKLL